MVVTQSYSQPSLVSVGAIRHHLHASMYFGSCICLLCETAGPDNTLTVFPQTKRHILQEELARRSRLSLVGELAATLVHEISQPLSAMASNVGALRLHLANDPPEALPAIEEEAQRAGQILTHLRALLRNDASLMQEQAVEKLVEEVLAMMSAKLHAQSIEVRRLLPAHLPMVRVAAVEVRMVLANLLRNAAEAMVDRTGAKLVEISASRKGRWIWIKIEDTGPGIPSEMREKIFDALFTTRVGGTGMGLAICRRVVAAHGGSIRASGRRSGGARFEFSLPVAG